MHFKSFIKKHDTAIARTTILIISSFILVFLTEWVAKNDISRAFFWIFNYPAQSIFTAILFFFIMFFIFTIIRRIDIPIFAVHLIFLSMSTAQYFKVSYRSEPLFPWDLSIIKEAFEITSEVDLSLTFPIIFAFAFSIVQFILFIFLRKHLIKSGALKLRKPDKKRRFQLIIQPAVSFIVLLCFCICFISDATVMKFFGIEEYPFRQVQAYNVNGTVLSFSMNVKYTTPQKPADYSQKSVSKAVIEIKEIQKTSALMPNIIFLMSESYADLRLCENVTFNDEIFIFTDYVKETGISGSLLTTQYGGGTCNSEFEVLTGHSMTYLPSGCTPYQQYFNTEQDTFASYLKQLGYTTVAIHSYGEKFWNRNVAYPNMGFDKFISEEDFSPDAKRRRGLIKDEELVSVIISEYESNKSTGKPFFNFSVSMQNHGSFTDGQYLENYRTSLSCDALTKEQEGILTTYATGIRDADYAFGTLIEYFSQVDEPTIICMFGDHLGSLGGSDEIYIKSGYMDDPEESAEATRRKYSTPFYIYDNFSDLHFEAKNMSLYQLIPQICDWYSLNSPKYFDYLVEQSKSFKGSGLGIYLDKDGNAVYELDDTSKKYIDKHKLLQYDLMFGEHFSSGQIYSYN